MPGFLTCLGVAPNQKHVVQFIVPLCLWSRSNTSESMSRLTKDEKKIIESFQSKCKRFLWMIGWLGVGSCPERDLHCGAELLHKRRLWRRSHGCCHRAGVVLQVVVRSCLSGALQSPGPGESFGEQQPRDPLEFGIVRDWSRRHQGGEPGVWSGFRCGSAKRLAKTLPAPDSSDFLDPQHLLFCGSTSSFRFRVTFAV